MNKEELIQILQERSQESINDDLYGEEAKKEESEYLRKFKLRRRRDKERFFLITSVVILLSLVGFLGYQQIQSQSLLNPNEYISKSELSFNDLNKDEQEKYLLRSEIDQYQEQLQNRDRQYISKLEQNLEKVQAELSKANSTPSAEIQKMFEPKDAKLLSLAKMKLKRFDGRGCYDVKAGAATINKKCQTKIINYLKSVSKLVVRVEIIPVADPTDTKAINKNAKTAQEKALLKEGLMRQRIIQGAKLVQRTLGKNTIVNFASYTVETANKRGVIIRTYFK